jgi:hypothetical protein
MPVSFRETLTGNYWLLERPTDERAVALNLRAHARDLRLMAHAGTWRLSGTIDAERLAVGRALQGTLDFKRLDERRLPYRFTFQGDDGRRYEFSGQKEWNGLAPIESITLLRAGLYDERGEEVARATLRWDLRADWARWLGGWTFTGRSAP